MSKSNATEPEKEIGNKVRLKIYRIPKKNLDRMVQNQNNLLMFLESTDATIRFFNSTLPDSSNQDGEVWMNLESYGNCRHMDEAISMFMKDENTLSLMNSNLNSLAH